MQAAVIQGELDRALAGRRELSDVDSAVKHTVEEMLEAARRADSANAGYSARGPIDRWRGHLRGTRPLLLHAAKIALVDVLGEHVRSTRGSLGPSRVSPLA